MKEKIIEYKKYIVLIIIVLLYVLFAMIFFKKNEKPAKQKSYFVTNNSQFIISETNKWENENEKKEFNWKKYNIYINNKKIGEYSLQHNKKWYIFDNNKNSIKYEGRIIAFSNINASVKDFEVSNIDDNDMELINKYLVNNGIELVTYKTSNAKYTVDIDNDNKKEIIYKINSIIENNPNNIFSIILLNDQNNLKEIAKKVNKNDLVSNIIRYELYGIIDIDNDKNFEIIVTKMKYSKPDLTCEIIKKENKNGFYDFASGCDI